MASRGRRGRAPAREDEPRREERAEQQAPAPQGPVLPPPPPVDYGVFMQGLVQAMQTQAHTQAALQAQLEAQEGEMEQYLEEKKASHKRPATTFQRQDKKKAVYRTQQCSVAVGSTQGVQRGAPAPAVVAVAAPATGRLGRPRAPARVFSLACEDVEQAEHVTEDPEIPGASKPSHWGDVPNGYQAIPSPLRGLVGDTPLEETVESNSERGE
ncbi:hypothetical protein Taro_000564 [Colocasia esculenta]|uniref:Uncharacterized protein n=1 Tax=Colocasia esculenta TaxID=4460 RepID=A0A843TDH2_COLES|nr:hypothetical protein [Colocasia esculenta]